MEYKIREIREGEYGLLEDFLYEAIFIPEGIPAPPREIIEKPELQIYTAGFGTKKGDMGLVAEAGQRIVGAVWTRIMDDYGHIDDETPSLAISLYSGWRGRGIGTALMREMQKKLMENGYGQASLSVQKANYAVKMYQNVGFKIVSENEEEYIMRWRCIR